MDVFQTTVTSCVIIYRFLEGRGKYSAQSKSLAARFKWDSRVLQKIVDYFTARRHGGKLSEEDAALLDETMVYLNVLGERLKDAQSKITSSGWLSKEVKKALWPLRRDELVELELELFEWTQRLDMRLLALPEKLRHGIVSSSDDEAEAPPSYSPTLLAQRKMEKFLGKNQAVKRKQWEDLWIDDPESRVTFSNHSPARFMTADFSSRRVIIEYKPYPAHFESEKLGYESIKGEVGELAAALSTLDPNTIGLLKCIGFFHESDPPSFALVHEIPFTIDQNPPSLKGLISETDSQRRRLLPAHPLNERFELARKLSAAVLFIHSVGWVHKGIRSQNVLVIEKRSASKKGFPYSLGNPYLANFQSSRSNDAETDPLLRGGLRWEEEIYHHPDRQRLLQNNEDARYLMVHDIYSLGVVLLELGLWRPLEKYAGKLKDNTPQGRREFLIGLAEETQIAMGRRYKDLVVWCLQLESDSPTANIRYATSVLETLEELATALI